MVQGAISQDQKSLLIFLVKELGKKGICSIAYLNQVLNPIVFSWFNSLSVKQKEEFLFIEDRAKIYKSIVKLLRKLRGLRGFDQLLSSPDLNLIKKVQRQMKNEIIKLETVPTLIKDIKEVL